MMTLPETVAITRQEGGEWERFVPHIRPPDQRGHLIHSILFSDGTAWDAYNGWRPQDGFTRSRSRGVVRRFRPEPIDAAGWAEAAFS